MKRTGRNPRPPGPRGRFLVGSQLDFLRDPLDFLTRAHLEHGPLVSLPINGRSVVGVFGADAVNTVTSSYGREVEISVTGGVALGPPSGDLQGRGPLNATGAEHALYRRVSVRGMRGESGNAYAAAATDLTVAMLDSWRPGTEIDLLPVIEDLARRIFKRHMFGTDIAVTDPELDAAVNRYIAVMDSLPRRLGTTLIPFDVPGISRSATLRRDLAFVDRRVVDTTRDGAPPSLAATLVRELDRMGAGDDRRLARELMLQLYFAGLSSVGSTIVWTFLLLALHPGPARKLLAELDTAFGGQVPQPGDDTVLPYLDAVVNESMRLYPGAAYEFKRLDDSFDVHGYRLPAGTSLLMTPWVTQRSPHHFDDPLTFRPERFADRTGYPKGAFAPWGFGNRSCVGKPLARVAIRTVLSATLQRFRLDLVPGQRIDPHAGRFGIRLLPRPGVRVRLAPQDGDTESSARPVAGSIVGGTPGPRILDGQPR
jgi:cytochrome P450